MGDHGEKPEHVAEILAGFYSKSFGGRKDTRFRISRKYFRIVSKLKVLTDAYIQRVQVALLEMEPGYILINMDKYFAVLPVKNLLSYRRVTEAALIDGLKEFCSRRDFEYQYPDLSSTADSNQSEEE